MGRAPIDKIHRQFHCHHCEAKFYIDASGEVVLGDLAPGRMVPKRRTPSKRGGTDYVEAAFNRWRTLSGPVRMLVVATSALLVFLIAWLIIGPPLPKALDARATYAADAVIHNEVGRLSALSSPDSESYSRRWVQELGPYLKQRLGDDIHCEVVVQMQDRRGKRGIVELRFLPSASTGGAVPIAPASVKGGSDSVRYLSFTSMWVLSNQGDWLLDGLQTYHYARSRLAAESSGAGSASAGSVPNPRENLPTQKKAPAKRTRVIVEVP